MSFLTNQDVIELQKVAIQRVAQCLDINTDYKSMFEVFDEISKTNDPLYDLLDSFIVCYRQYQNYHFYLDRDAIPGNLSDFQQQGLTKVIENRDKTRQAVLDALDKRGC
ncbi:MAG: hypothetical protein RID25_08575 [Cyclobacteriaceae bacterium]